MDFISLMKCTNFTNHEFPYGILIMVLYLIYHLVMASYEQPDTYILMNGLDFMKRDS